MRPENQEIQRFLQLEVGNGNIFSHMSPAAVPHMEKVHSIIRQVYGRSPTDDSNDLDENNAFCVFFHEAVIEMIIKAGVPP